MDEHLIGSLDMRARRATSVTLPLSLLLLCIFLGLVSTSLMLHADYDTRSCVRGESMILLFSMNPIPDFV